MARRLKRGQVREMHLDIIWQRRLKATSNYGQPCTSTKKKQFGMTYIHCAQSRAKIYLTVFGSWQQQTRIGRWGERERGREREIKGERETLKVLTRCVFGVNNKIHRKGNWPTLQCTRSADSTEGQVQQYSE